MKKPDMTRFRSSAATLLLLAASQSALLLVTDSQASAAPYCSFEGHYDGMTKDPDTTLYGARALVEQENPNLCGAGNASSAWVMVEAKEGGYTNYAQSGYRDRGSNLTHSGYHNFAQWTLGCFPNNCTGATYTDQIDAAPTSATNYKVYVQASTGHILMDHDGTNIGDTGYNVSGDWDPAYKVTFTGETHSINTDMPGHPADKVSFTSVQRYESNGSINYINGGALSKIPDSTSCGSGCIYGYDRYSPATGQAGLKIWTN